MHNINKVMVYAEVIDGQVGASYFELLSKAKSILSGDVKYAAVITGSKLDKCVDELKASGADVVYAADDARLAVFNVKYVAAAVKKAIEEFKPDMVLVGATPFGEEVAPTLGHNLDTGVAAHCVDIVNKGEEGIAYMVPAFGGKVIGEIFIPNTLPEIASIKPGVFEAVPQEAKNAEVVAIGADVLDAVKTGVVVKNVEVIPPAKMPIEKAPVIVCGGFGIGSKEAYDKLEELAIKLGGAAACTRPVLDAGWAPADEGVMIGSSGKAVKPKLYIGTGISGAAHHLCGIKNAGVIININTDENAESFAASNYKVVADGMSVIEKLIEML